MRIAAKHRPINPAANIFSSIDMITPGPCLCPVLNVYALRYHGLSVRSLTQDGLQKEQPAKVLYIILQEYHMLIVLAHDYIRRFSCTGAPCGGRYSAGLLFLF
jgi:hypothetical protein